MERSEFIKAMRSVANSVAVVTTDGSAGRHGATVSAFSSVSADPPTILVCLAAMSRIAAMVEENGKFNVNVLADGSSHFADRFAGMHDGDVSDRFDGIEFEACEMPKLPNATVFSCDIDQAISSGSHKILIGKVCATSPGNTQPLAYLDGTYHQVLPLDQNNKKANHE